MSYIKCDKCDYKGKPEIMIDGWGNHYYYCKECAGEERDMIFYKKDYCDNVDCCSRGKSKRLVRKVRMKEEYEGGEVYWCEECIDKDNEFIEED